MVYFIVLFFVGRVLHFYWFLFFVEKGLRLQQDGVLYMGVSSRVTGAGEGGGVCHRMASRPFPFTLGLYEKREGGGDTRFTVFMFATPSNTSFLVFFGVFLVCSVVNECCLRCHHYFTGELFEPYSMIQTMYAEFQCCHGVSLMCHSVSVFLMRHPRYCGFVFFELTGIIPTTKKKDQLFLQQSRKLCHAQGNANAVAHS